MSEARRDRTLVREMNHFSPKTRPVIRAFAITILLAVALGAANSASASQVSIGQTQSCLLKSDGVVLCLGSNTKGQLGNPVASGSTDATSEPTATTLADAAVQLTTGMEHTCALVVTGNAMCFGANNFGQLGGPTRDPDSANPAPRRARTSGAVKQVSAGSGHTCALLTDLSLECWGQNNYGQLGNTTDNLTDLPHDDPVPVGLQGATSSQVAAGWFHTCVLLTNKTVKCFGKNRSGQVGSTYGNENATGLVATANLVAIGAPVIDVAAGGDHTCVVTDIGAVRCFGDNFSGQLGKTENIYSGEKVPPPHANPVPNEVPLDGTAVQVSAGRDSSCALMSNGVVKCWGSNAYGKLGRALEKGTPLAQPAPQQVWFSRPATQVVAGPDQTCALLDDSSVECVGNNPRGQLGPNFLGTFSSTPFRLAEVHLKVADPPATTPPPAPLTPSPLSDLASFVRPNFKAKASGAKIALSGYIGISADALSAARCSGSVRVALRLKAKSLAAKSFPLKLQSGRCGATAKLTLAKKYARKRLTVKLSLTGALRAPELTLTKKL